MRSFKIGKPTHISQARAKGYDFGIIVEFDSQADYEAYEKDDRHMTWVDLAWIEPSLTLKESQMTTFGNYATSLKSSCWTLNGQLLEI